MVGLALANGEHEKRFMVPCFQESLEHGYQGDLRAPEIAALPFSGNIPMATRSLFLGRSAGTSTVECVLLNGRHDVDGARLQGRY